MLAKLERQSAEKDREYHLSESPFGFCCISSKSKDLEADLVLLNIKKVVALAEDEVRRGEYGEICNRNIGDSESQLNIRRNT